GWPLPGPPFIWPSLISPLSTARPAGGPRRAPIVTHGPIRGKPPRPPRFTPGTAPRAVRWPRERLPDLARVPALLRWGDRHLRRPIRPRARRRRTPRPRRDRLPRRPRAPRAGRGRHGGPP